MRTRCLIRLLDRCWREKSGQFTVVVALTAVPLIAAVGLAVDFQLISNERSRLQNALDSAALSAASFEGGSAADRERRGQEYFLSNSQNLCANAASFELSDDRATAFGQCTVRTNFASVLGRAEVGISASATAVWAAKSLGTGCIYALNNNSKPSSLSFNSVPLAELGKCVPVANSFNKEAITVNSVGYFHAGSIYTAGNVRVNSTPKFRLDQPANVGRKQVPDPYSGLADPSNGIVCKSTVYNSSNTYYPGVHCGDLVIKGSAVKLKPGTYFIVNGKLIMDSINNISCDCLYPTEGVTFVITGTSSDKIGYFEVNSVGKFDLRSPSGTKYPYPGILIYVDRDAKYQTSKFNSVITMIANGAIYAPSQHIQINSVDASYTECSQIIGYDVEFNSVESFARNENCVKYGAKDLMISSGVQSVRLLK
jgi:Flp pilus assembly protein TadG